jgi:hypothetical protein
MSYLDRIHECNAHDLGHFRPFRVGAVRVGWVKHGFAARLAELSGVFAVADDQVRLAAGLDDYAARTDAVDGALRTLAAAGEVPGWRDEPYPVGTGFHAAPLFQMERAAVPRFGIPAYGIHVNGYVRDGGQIRMWIGRRALDKPTYPGELDNMIAGGQPVGIGLMENVIKEAAEEAAVPAALAATAVAVGAISYCQETADGLKPDVMFTYDLELPADFVPHNTDGEIAEFMLLPAREVMEITEHTSDFKLNCALVNMDFFIRHGLLAPDHPDYVAIVRGLHR